MKGFMQILSALVLCAVTFSAVSNEIATLRQGVPLAETNQEPALLQNASNKDIKRARAYPMQPPTIPHHINNYQIDLKANKCLSCHARNRTEDSQAPMISVTHFMDRDGNFLADVSPRRYFCTQCHVTQVERKPLLINEFKDVKSVMNKE
jgi:cytochrome c-type protein NapB